MPAGKHKSRTYRRVHRKVPGGRTALHYETRKPRKAHCAGCGAILSGVPRERPYKIKKLAKTERRPQRPFGGKLCTQCLRRTIILKTRENK